jgi:hypothetical protein
MDIRTKRSGNWSAMYVEYDFKQIPLTDNIQIREKEMEIEIEERECGDEELISMMRAQLEIMKSLLVDELDAEEAIEDEILFDKEMYFGL